MNAITESTTIAISITPAHIEFYFVDDESAAITTVDGIQAVAEALAGFGITEGWIKLPITKLARAQFAQRFGGSVSDRMHAGAEAAQRETIAALHSHEWADG